MLRWTTTTAFLALLGMAGPALAVYPPGIKDEGKFFSKEATEKANRKIREIYEKYKRDVVVETFASLTPEQEKRHKEEADKFFAKMASDRGKEIGLHGVYILLYRKPRFLLVHMDPETQKTVFPVKARNATFGKIVARFKEGEFDAGLIDGLSEIESTFQTQPTPKKSAK